ncbi:MAG: hypothetical protein LPK19_10860, partial [Hymenobacteraceae bacterium]|nr:hypothetical protein [Hymenobacteraceae bacterium]MDX5396734.1 hypothetical protein [Hymenobacteraceae bacterium]MDX5512796.1 hypothetical protein [Hymenobacteraceae bacterium]
FLASLLAFSSCREEPNYPAEPRIEAEDVSVYRLAATRTLPQRDSIVLKIYYEDGNGDLGLSPEDLNPPFNSGSPFHHNFIVDVLMKQPDGSFKPLSTAFSYNGRFPVLPPDLSKSGSIEGTISYGGIVFPVRQFPNGQVFKFSVFIYDRALNKSNVVETEEIQLNY